MGGLLGPVGSLRELRCASSLDAAPVTDSVIQVVEGLDFQTEWVQLRAGRAARQWAVGVGTAEPHTVAQLWEWEERQRIDQTTLCYYPEHALTDNILDPEASLMHPSRWAGITRGGASVEPDTPGRPVFLHSGAGSTEGVWARLEGVPVPYLRTLTVSIVVTPHAGKTARLLVIERAVDGTEVRRHGVATVGEADRQRLHLTFTTSGEAALLSLAVHDALTIAAPQVTCTAAPVEWVSGQGCRRAVLMALPSERVQLAVPGLPWGRRSAFEWVIREIRRPD